jgi:imidazoleglycerol phosphate synthase cyclase subunit/phosphoribosyl-ATP pyrophosphohydrolase
MIKKRIIPCLDIANGQVVKGINFKDIKTIADPVEMAKYYYESGADELVFYDITASYENRGTMVELVKNVAKQVFIPLTVGGGVRTVDDFDVLLKSGADKISVNSSAIANPDLIREASERFGAQCVVLSMDVKRVGDQFKVFSKGGRIETELDAIEWAKRGVALGAGELVVNSIDTDGVKKGFDLELLTAISAVVNVPIVASGGAGKIEDFIALFSSTDIDAGLAASIFHSKEVSMTALKLAMKRAGIPVRLAYMPPLKWDERGLVPAIVQSDITQRVLMMAYMNETSLRETVKLGETVFFSRSRQELWHKGATSGNTQVVTDIRYDCDADTLLIKVKENGPACHTGSYTCFGEAPDVFEKLFETIIDRKENPIEGSYTNYLFEKGIDKILKKVGEECAEVIIGAKNTREELIYEMSDLFYHSFVLLVNEGISLKEIKDELQSRIKPRK